MLFFYSPARFHSKSTPQALRLTLPTARRRSPGAEAQADRGSVGMGGNGGTDQKVTPILRLVPPPPEELRHNPPMVAQLDRSVSCRPPSVLSPFLRGNGGSERDSDSVGFPPEGLPCPRWMGVVTQLDHSVFCPHPPFSAYPLSRPHAAAWPRRTASPTPPVLRNSSSPQAPATTPPPPTPLRKDAQGCHMPQRGGAPWSALANGSFVALHLRRNPSPHRSFTT